jgi:peptidyl-prolyl cis-trans isomerase B (cyclophilin B)
VVAAAREGDEKNPERRSGASQFYMVWGKVYDDRRLDYTQQKIDSITDGQVKITPEMREVYKTIGGTPHLDGQYTVFGEIIEGLDVVEAIQGVAVDKNDRPLEDIRILKATVTKDLPQAVVPKKNSPKKRAAPRRK